MSKIMAKLSAVPSSDIKIDVNGNKVVEPICWGTGGSVGGTVTIKR